MRTIDAYSVLAGGEFDRRTGVATRSLVPETGGLPVGAIWWAGGGLVIKVEPREAMSPLYGMRIVARGVQEDLDAVRNGLTTKWSSGQVEGQNNRLKTLTRDMYGGVSVETFVPDFFPCHTSECTQIPPEPI